MIKVIKTLEERDLRNPRLVPAETSAAVFEILADQPDLEIAWFSMVFPTAYAHSFDCVCTTPIGSPQNTISAMGELW